MADLSYSAEEASQALNISNDSATTSEEQLNAIIQKIAGYFDMSGSAMGGELGSVMGSSFDADIKPVFENLNNELSALINSVSSTNAAMSNVQDETTALYK